MSDFDELQNPSLFADAIAKFAPRAAGGKAARKARQKQISGTVDGRSLRATGRTELINFRASPHVKDLFERHVPRGKRSGWLEDAILQKLAADGIEPHA